MPWTDDTWDAFCAIVGEAWPGDFDPRAAKPWRLLLDDVEPQDAIMGVKRLMQRGGRFRPAVSELLAAIREDPSRPTFEEALQLIYGRGGILKARPEKLIFADTAKRDRAYLEAQVARAREVHPLVGSFAQRQGFERLATLELGDPEHGGARRHQLEQAWDRHVDAFDGRDVAVRALPPGDRKGLRKPDFDPLEVLPAFAGGAAIGELGPGGGPPELPAGPVELYRPDHLTPEDQAAGLDGK